MANPELEDILQKLRQLFGAEYARGEQDAIKRTMQMMQTTLGEFRNGHSPSRTTQANYHLTTTTESSRAPRGSVDALINRVLKERGTEGATATEIEKSAASATEKTASLSGIRFALDRGRKQGRLLNREGRWFLNVTAEP